jgi:hypothetical protein
MQRGRRVVVGAAMLIIGGVAGFTLPHSNASPGTEKGFVVSVGNAPANADLRFEFKPVKGAKETFRIQPATPWRKSPGSNWIYKGEPSCLVPGSVTARPVTIGVVNTSTVGSAGGRTIVVWLECYT